MLRRSSLLAAAVALLATSSAARAETVREPHVFQQDGVEVLVLDGTPHEEGVEEGEALAKEILTGAGYLAKLEGDHQLDPEMRKTVRAKFVWDQDLSDELDGILEGVGRALGDATTVPGTDRKLSREDLEGLNTLADILPFGCSSFTVYGDRVQGGGTITARNLDYPVLPGLVGIHLVEVRRSRDGLHAWATVTWPGLIGCYTGMNDEGVTCSIHDVPTSALAFGGSGFTPRSIGLRRIVEHVGAKASFADDAAAILRKCPVIYGNNIHVSAPLPASASGPHGVVLEWDPDQSQDGGVTVRAEEPGVPLVCTNHWRKRRDPETCPRFAAITAYLQSAKPLTPDTAFEALTKGAVSGDRVLTIHSVVFLLESKTMLVAFAKDAAHAAPFERPARIDLGALFAPVWR